MSEIQTGQHLDDFLMNLADGLSKAQSQLNRYPVKNSLGQDALIYHIPKMDFELNLEMTSSESQQSSGLAMLRFSPKQSSSSTETASSVIKGSLVAMPIEGGLPLISLALSAKRQSARLAMISVTARDSQGQPLGDHRVEINIDRELSNRLNKQEGRSKSLQPATRLEQSSILLDQSGQATAELQISNREAKEQLIALVADLAGKTETLLFRLS